MEVTEVTEETCIIVVEISQADRKFSTSVVVDHVQEVLDIAGEDIEEAPQFGSAVNTDFILGMGKIAESVKILLDIDRVLANEDFNSVTDYPTDAFNTQEDSTTDEQMSSRTENNNSVLSKGTKNVQD